MQQLAKPNKFSQPFQGLDIIPLPTVLVDNRLNFLHYNKAFEKLILQANSVFPDADMDTIFPGFAEIVTLPGDAQEQTILENFAQINTRKVYDFHVSQINRDLMHLEGFVVTCIDVTEKIARLRPIEELSQHHRQFLEHTKTGVIIHRNGLILYANAQANFLSGMQGLDTLIGKQIWPFISTNSMEKVVERINGIVNDNAPAAAIEQQFIRVDGTVLDVDVFAYPVLFEGTTAVKSIFSDIGDRKKAERLLANSKKQYLTLVENLTDVVFQTDTEAKFIYLNPSWEKLTGYLITESTGNSCFNYLTHPNDTVGFYQKVRKLLISGIQDFQYDLLLNMASGEKRFVEVSLKPIVDDNREIIGINGIIRDIHAKKTADIEIKKIQSTLKHHQNILVSLTKEESIINGDFISAVNTIAKVTAETLNVNRVNIWKFSEDISTLSCLTNYDADLKEYIAGESFTYNQFPNYFDVLIKDRIIIADDVYNNPRTAEFIDIYLKPLEIKSMLDIAIGDGDRIWGIICIEKRFNFYRWTVEDQSFARSISDFITLATKSEALKVTQQELLNQENLYRTLIAQATDAIVIIDHEDKFLDVNNAACLSTGYSREELLSMTISDLMPDRFKYKGIHLSAILRKTDGFFGEHVYLNKNGEERYLEISTRVFEDGKIQGIARDITDRKLQEQALKASEARLELALKGADLGVWDFYIQENKMVHNDNWAELLGYYFDKNKISQTHWDKLIHPDDKEVGHKAFQDHLSGVTPYYEATLRMLASNGEWRWILDKGKITEWDKQGKPLRASGIHQDITTIKDYQQQLIYQRKSLQAILNASPNLIYVKNSNNQFVSVNHGLIDFMATTEEALLNFSSAAGKSFNTILNKLTEKDIEVFFTKDVVFVEEQQFLSPKTGEAIWFKSIKVPLIDEAGGFTEVLSVSMDITEIKLKEQQLSLLNDSLEQKVNERTALLEAANKELETFNYSVSHDLRTPLRSIDIFAYFLDKHYSNVLDKDGLENIRQIRRSITRMSLLIDNLLIFSKIGRSEKHFIQIDTHALIKQVIADLGVAEDLKHFKFVYGELPTIYGDYPMIQQAFINLINNAIKFSKTRPRPVIEFFGYNRDGFTTLAVRDNGVGFSMELRDKLFTAFKRLHSDEEFEGTGVGLAIVERIIKRHNGTLWAESKEEVGSTFYFKIPVAQ